MNCGYSETANHPLVMTVAARLCHLKKAYVVTLKHDKTRANHPLERISSLLSAVARVTK